jgi:hypothetical protein
MRFYVLAEKRNLFDKICGLLTPLDHTQSDMQIKGVKNTLNNAVALVANAPYVFTEKLAAFPP